MGLWRKLRLWSLVTVVGLGLAACGGGESAQPSTQPLDPLAAKIKAGPEASAPVFLLLTSPAGEFIGQGQTYRYSKANALVSASYAGGVISVSVQGRESWEGRFEVPGAPERLRNGAFRNLGRYPMVRPGMSWSGEGRACNALTGSFFLTNVTYTKAGALDSFDLAFEQYCDGAKLALTGAFHWNANDSTTFPGPVNPPPAGLWKPESGATPASGRYVYLKSDAGDYIGGGQTYLYTGANATLSATGRTGGVQFRVDGAEWWSGDFQAMQGVTQLQPGYYGSLQRYPFHNPAAGGLNWSGNGRGCNALTGWFVVDSVSYVEGALSSIKLRFEQHCEGAAAALRGEINWTATDTTSPSGPVNPPPATLWKPEVGATPASGRYIYLKSDAGDYIGAGQTYLYTGANAVLSMTGRTGGVQFGVNGDQWWTGNFQAMQSLAQLQPGYYPSLQRYPFHNPATGGLDWSGSGRGCNTLTGWFVVDSVSYVSGALSSIKLRFEQHCEGAAAALRGEINWTATDTTSPSGPVNPPPATLWKPEVGATPASGRYIYLKSDAGDYIGAGQTYLYTGANAVLSMTGRTGGVQFGVNGDQWWTGNFQAMQSLAQLQPGYYPSLQRYPFHNPATGGLDWSGSGRGCNTLTGWFVVDSVSYVSGALSSIKLRFEQHCEGAAAALRGEINWTATDATTPSGPVNPPPADLWKPAAGVVPSTGNVAYLQSDPGDYIGAGQTYLYTTNTATFSVSSSGGRFSMAVGGWHSDFQAMSTLAQLQPGYYADLSRYPFHNPAKGGLDWSGNGRGCNTLKGWFVVDEVTYVNGVVTSIALRFEQHCEGATPALRGQLRWQQ